MSYKCIYNAVIVTMNLNRDIIENGVLVIKDSEIFDIGDSKLLSKYDYEEKIDAKNGIVLPGFINGHTHVSMSVFRSLGEDIPDRLRRYMFPLEDSIVDAELVRVGAKLSIAEMLLGGVTTFADMYYFEDEVAKAAKEMGIRAIAGETIINKPSPDSNKPYGSMEYAEKFIEKWKNDELVTPALAPHATYSVDEEHLRKIKEISQKHKVPILMHISEMDFEMEQFKEKYNCTPVKFLENINFLSSKVIGAHLVYATEDDMEIMLKHDVGVIHNVAANAKAARPVAPVPSMIERGIKVGLGTDGPMSGNHLDIINLLDQYTKIQKIATGARNGRTSLEAVELGTISCAKAIEMGNVIGSIEIGKKADVIIIDTNCPNMQPIYDYYSAIVYSAYPHNVSMTMVNGKVVMKDRKLINEDLNKIIDETRKLQDKIKEAVAKLNKLKKSRE